MLNTCIYDFASLLPFPYIKSTFVPWQPLPFAMVILTLEVNILKKI